MKVLVTGCHGFVGHHVCRRLLAAGHTVVGTDRLVDAHSPKAERVAAMEGLGLKFVEASLGNLTRCRELMGNAGFDVVVHLAAQYPIPHNVAAVGSYLDSNLRAFLNIMETAKATGVSRVVFASTVAIADKGRPGSLYGATKIFNEHAAHVYSRMGLETAGLRFAAVYGPLMRSDAGIYRALLGQLTRSPYTGRTFRSKRPLLYIDDAAELTARFATAPAYPEKHSIHLAAADDWVADYGDVIERAAPLLGVEPIYPPGYGLTGRDVRPDLSSLDRFIDWRPPTALDMGVRPLADWLRRTWRTP